MNTTHALALTHSLAALSNRELLKNTRNLTAKERGATVAVVAHLAEVESRKLHLAEGCESLYAYCTQVLRYSEYAAYGRMKAARLSRKFPVILEYLADGRLHLAGLLVLAPHLDAENCRELLESAVHRSKREIEALVAKRVPVKAPRMVVRALGVVSGAPGSGEGSGRGSLAVGGPEGEKLKAPTVAGVSVSEAGEGGSETAARGYGASCAALQLPPGEAPGNVLTTQPSALFRIHFTADQETVELLQKAQDLLAKSRPAATPEDIMKLALQKMVAELEKAKAEIGRKPKKSPASGGYSNSRHIPAQVKRAVWSRDKACCAFLAPSGKRCGGTRYLEYHHVVPYAHGGPATVENIQLRCRAHNVYEEGVYEELSRPQGGIAAGQDVRERAGEYSVRVGNLPAPRSSLASPSVARLAPGPVSSGYPRHRPAERAGTRPSQPASTARS